MISGLDPKKYTVLKGEERLDDESVFVIRSGDILAVPALSAYRQTILQLLDLDDVQKQLTENQRDHLINLAEGVDNRIDKWSAVVIKKIPD